MTEQTIYRDIAKRSNGDIYIGVVGPVRVGKSTFIRRFLESTVLPNIDDVYDKERTLDSMPQAASGKTVMTTEPKFIPDEAVRVVMGDQTAFNVRLIDSVGYLVPEALGQMENGVPRMVSTPWSEEPIAFATAAEIGTHKVITDHSTVGILVTCDGTICELPRSAYLEAEARVAREMNEMHKPYVIVLNSANPASEQAQALAYELEEKYGAPVALVNCAELSSEDISHIMALMLSEFPVTEVRFELPRWVGMLEKSHPLRTSIFESIAHGTDDIFKTGDIKPIIERFGAAEDGTWVLKEIDAGTGIAHVEVQLHPEVYFAVLSELTGLLIKDDADLFAQMQDLAKTSVAYSKVAKALEDVNETGYGIVMPDSSELRLEEPRIVKQAGGYGIKLRASAPSIHMMKAMIDTEINPVVGAEVQSEEMVRYLLKEFEEDPTKIWDSNMFGKSLYELTSESIHTKLAHMPEESRAKLSETLERIINEGSSGLICILL